MNNLAYSLATDFCAAISARTGRDDPIDEYIDPIAKVFGNTPDQEDSLRVYRDEIPRLRQELVDWLEIDITEKEVREIMQVALVNYFGDDIEFT